MLCEYCGKQGIYRCSVCGKIVCDGHARLRVNCPSCLTKAETHYTIRRTRTDAERKAIGKMVEQFWGEAEQMTFDKTFDVAELPAYVARADGAVVGFLSFAEHNDALIVVALGVEPRHQGFGVGRSLIQEAEREVKRMGKKELLVSTSNDDLPALAFYQSVGFQIYEVKPNIIAQKHGKILSGIGGLPIRDEIRLRKLLSGKLKIS